MITVLLLASPLGHCLRGRPERESRTPVNIEKELYRDNGEGVASAPLPYPLERSPVPFRS